MTFCIPQGDVGRHRGPGYPLPTEKRKNGITNTKNPGKQKSPPVKGGVGVNLLFSCASAEGLGDMICNR